ncbi:MAG TPA: potassium channel family protein [Pyrinomonadaceae bacterium]|nr:potassium channel family protein [Pyrinomonadaceae bacterium]
MAALSGIVGVLLITVVLWDVFETIVLPRRVTRRLRLTRLFYMVTWRPWRVFGGAIKSKKTRETVLGIYGPLSLLVLLTVWAFTVIVGFALIQWALGSRVGSTIEPGNIFTDFYYSGTTFFTLGLGDLAPFSAAARLITVAEASLGLGMLALVIGYLPVLYQAFSRREVNISMLDARAGTPPTAVELLRRHQEGQAIANLDEWLRDWEMWAADLMESHLSYPVLCFFRSQHDNQSWLAALSTVLDTCSLVMVGIEGIPKWQAQLTFKMARHALVDISQIFNTSPLQHDGSRMNGEQLAALRSQLAAREVPLSNEPGDDKTLEELRALYEPYTQVLSQYLLMQLPSWLPQARATDNWQTSAWEVRAPAPDQPFQKCMAKTHRKRASVRTALNKPQ